MKKTLLLNQDGEPLAMVSWTKALGLVFRGKVTVYEYWDDEVHSETRTFKVPSVIGLLSYVAVPQAQTVRLSKHNLLVRDNWECVYCNKHLTTRSVTIDHVLPQSRGGKHVWDNVLASCKPCNNQKRNRTPAEARMAPSRRPWTPRRSLIIKQRAERLGYDGFLRYIRVQGATG